MASSSYPLKRAREAAAEFEEEKLLAFQVGKLKLAAAATCSLANEELKARRELDKNHKSFERALLAIERARALAF